jgi:hypothetical protein
MPGPSKDPEARRQAASSPAPIAPLEQQAPVMLVLNPRNLVSMKEVDLAGYTGAGTDIRRDVSNVVPKVIAPCNVVDAACLSVGQPDD